MFPSCFLKRKVRPSFFVLGAWKSIFVCKVQLTWKFSFHGEKGNRIKEILFILPARAAVNSECSMEFHLKQAEGLCRLRYIVCVNLLIRHLKLGKWETGGEKNLRRELFLVLILQNYLPWDFESSYYKLLCVHFILIL